MSMPEPLFAMALPAVLFLVLWGLVLGPLAHVVRAARAVARSGSARLARSGADARLVRHAGPLGRYAPILVLVVGGGLAALGAGYLFAELAENLRRSTSAVNAIDQSVQAWFGHERQPALTALLSFMTTFGGTIALGLIVVAVAVVLLVRRDRATAIFLVVTTVTGALLNLGLKLLFARARPDLASAIAAARWFSFPSGHAMGSFITYGALAYIVLRQHWPWRARSACLALAGTMAGLVGLSRVYLGVHWTSDIAGAWSAGTVWLATAVVAFEMLVRLRERHHDVTPRPAGVERTRKAGTS